MQPEGSLPHVQEPTICPYPKPVGSSPWLSSHFSKIQFIIILPSTPGSSKWFLSSGIPTKPLSALILVLVRATYPARLIFLDLLSQMIFREGYRE